MAFGEGDEKSCIFGARLMERASEVMKTAALANGVRDQRIDTHNLRAGGLPPFIPKVFLWT